MFITAVPIIKLFAWGRGDSGGHVLRETTSRGLCGFFLSFDSTARSKLGFKVSRVHNVIVSCRRGLRSSGAGSLGRFVTWVLPTSFVAWGTVVGQSNAQQTSGLCGEVLQKVHRDTTLRQQA